MVQHMTNLSYAHGKKISERNVTVENGNIESAELDALFEWDTECNVLPLQVIQYRLASIRQLPCSSVPKFHSFICNNYFNKTCKVHILDISADNAIGEAIRP